VTSEKVKILERKDKYVRVEPYSYLKAQLGEIVKVRDKNTDYHGSLSQVLDLPMKNGKIMDGDAQRLPGDWFAMSSIYGFYVRSFTAFDHDLDGELGGSKSDITLNSEGLRETGTFLKSMAILPYVKSLGFDTVYMLPIALTGTANKKGDLGSPYALRNPFKINPMYHDPLVDEFSVETEFKAFVEAAHVLGLRIVLDMVPRTASRDSDWFKDNPDWFYWIDRAADANYHSPEFTRDD
jgi:pullulanase/glycogen debranching enzyme